MKQPGDESEESNCELNYDDYTFIEMYMKKRERQKQLGAKSYQRNGDGYTCPTWDIYLKSLIERFNEVEKLLRISPRCGDVDRATQRRFNVYVEDSILRII